MKTAVVVPVKNSEPKSRLASILSEPARRKLTLVALSDVLKAFGSANEGMEIFVVSSDQEVLREAAEAGTNLVGEREDAGVNSAVSLAMKLTADADRWLVVPSDIPFVRPEDIARVLELSEGGRVVIAPSREMNGTNLLLMGKDSRISLHYDEDSFWGHLRDAAGRGLGVAVYAQMTVMLDIDSARDVEACLEMNISTETTKFLRQELTNRTREGGSR
jgi:2-phospho-L-lactate guanylyltransferase